jgi:hypothetical protein
MQKIKTMAYNKKKILEQSKTLIQSENLMFIDEVVSMLPISRATFYVWFPAKSDESDTLKELLDKNRIKTKVTIRAKWAESNNATLQIALYKLISTKKELARLNGSNVKADITSKGKQIHTPSSITVNIVPPIDYDDDDDESEIH